MLDQRIGRRIATAAIALGLVTAAAACGSDDEAADTTGSVATTRPAANTTPNSGAATTPNTAKPVECTGNPVKFGTIYSLTGGPSVLFTGIKESIEAAEAAINETCEIGRPIQIDVCDDKGDPNEAAVCGRKIAGEGAIAVIGEAGAFDEGIATAALPVMADHGGAGYALTSPVAFSATPTLTFAYGFPNLVKAAGATDLLWVSADQPALEFNTTIIAPGAEAAGISFDKIFFPSDTTDYATVAAQVASKKPTSLVFGSQQPAPLVKALAAEGITTKNTVIISATPLGDDQVAALGDLAEGIYQTTGTYPYTDLDNEGIAQMHAEFEAAGLDDSKVNFLGVASWSEVHSVATALSALTPAEIDALPGKPDAFVAALVKASPLARPEMTPYDLSHVAWTVEQNPILGKFRSFSRSGVVQQVKDGKYVVVSDGFVDFSKPFTLKAG